MLKRLPPHVFAAVRIHLSPGEDEYTANRGHDANVMVTILQRFFRRGLIASVFADV